MTVGGGKKGKGGKKKRRAKGGNNAIHERHLLLSDGPQQQYAQAIKMLGDRRVIANCYNPANQSWSEKMIHIRGKMRKRVWLNIGDFVLITTRSFETGNIAIADSDDSEDNNNNNSTSDFGGDVIHVYQPTEIKKLVKLGAFIMPHDDDDDDCANNGRHKYVDSDDEDEVIEPNAPIDDDKPKVPMISAQTKNYDMPPSDDESMNSEDLLDALANL